MKRMKSTATNPKEPEPKKITAGIKPMGDWPGYGSFFFVFFRFGFGKGFGFISGYRVRWV